MGYGQGTYSGQYYKFSGTPYYTYGYIKLTAGVDYCILPMPQWGYSTDINMSISITETNSAFKHRDNASTYDYRTCKIPVIFLDAILAKEFSDFIRSKSAGRDNTITMDIVGNSGFYPFGADKASAGQFTVNILDYNLSDKLYAPYEHFKLSLELKLITAPSASAITEISQGPMTMAGIAGLMLPQESVSNKNDYGVKVTQSLSGAYGSVDSKFEKFTIEFLMKCNTGKCSALLNALVTTVRANTFTIDAGDNVYLFGIENNKSGAHQCKMIQNKITVTHDDYNQFSFNLKLWKVA